MPEWFDSSVVTAILSTVTAILVLAIGRREKKTERTKAVIDQEMAVQKMNRITQGDMMRFIRLYFQQRDMIREYDDFVDKIFDKYVFINGDMLQSYKEMREKSAILHNLITDFFTE